VNKSQILAALGILFTAICMGLFVARYDFNPQAIGLIALALVFIPTLIKPDIGFIIIIISMLFSPDIILGKTSAREIAVRVDDIFLLLVIFAWLIRSAFSKDLSKAFSNKLTPLFFSYITICLVSSVIAATIGRIDLKLSLLSILKYAEYFLLFLMVKDNLKNMRQVKLFVLVFLLTALIVSVHTNLYIQDQINAGVTFFRVAPPVESRGGGEANTMGGYLLFMLAMTAGLLLYSRNFLVRVFLIILALFMLRSFLYTLSRGSYLAFLPVAVALVFLSRKLLFGFLVGAIIVIVVMFMPQMVKERVSQTVVPKEGVGGRYMDLEESPKLRLDSWKNVIFEKFPKSPLIGHGVAKGFIDGQFFSTLNEVGFLGLMVFIWILIRLFNAARLSFHYLLKARDNFALGITAGFIAGFVGLLFHSISTNTFIIIRIMEPFWFIAAIVVSLPGMLPQEASGQ